MLEFVRVTRALGKLQHRVIVTVRLDQHRLVAQAARAFKEKAEEMPSDSDILVLVGDHDRHLDRALTLGGWCEARDANQVAILPSRCRHEG